MLSDKFRIVVVTLLAYLLLTVVNHALLVFDNDDGRNQLPTGLMALGLVQRLLAPFHYYLVKRSALQLSDPRYHEMDRMEWINERMACTE